MSDRRTSRIGRSVLCAAVAGAASLALAAPGGAAETGITCVPAAAFSSNGLLLTLDGQVTCDAPADHTITAAIQSDLLASSINVPLSAGTNSCSGCGSVDVSATTLDLLRSQASGGVADFVRAPAGLTVAGGPGCTVITSRLMVCAASVR